MNDNKKLIDSAITKVTQILLGHTLNKSTEAIIRATKYISPNLIVRGVLKTYKIHDRNPRKGANSEITLTIGRPNLKERNFIKDCKKAKEPFPVRNIITKMVPSKKK